VDNACSLLRLPFAVASASRCGSGNSFNNNFEKDYYGNSKKTSFYPFHQERFKEAGRSG
jgi:hypothetical protein